MGVDVGVALGTGEGEGRAYKGFSRGYACRKNGKDKKEKGKFFHIEGDIVHKF